MSVWTRKARIGLMWTGVQAEDGGRNTERDRNRETEADTETETETWRQRDAAKGREGERRGEQVFWGSLRQG
jgi:hypothetical protein